MGVWSQDTGVAVPEQDKTRKHMEAQRLCMNIGLTNQHGVVLNSCPLARSCKSSDAAQSGPVALERFSFEDWDCMGILLYLSPATWCDLLRQARRAYSALLLCNLGHVPSSRLKHLKQAQLQLSYWSMHSIKPCSVLLPVWQAVGLILIMV